MRITHAHLNAVTEPILSDPAGSSEPEGRTIERRTAVRVDLNVGVGFRSGSNFYTGFTSDISEGGLFVASHMLQPIGSELALTFALPTGPEISVRGIVRWQREVPAQTSVTPPGMGVEFEAMRSQDLERIREFVALREPLFYIA
jgi:uncharacterized protein (TIGR02266 family)